MPSSPNYAERVLLSVFSARSGRGHTGALDGQVQEYLKRMQAPWRAEARVFRTEAALLEAVAQERRAAPVVVWLLDSRGNQLSSEQFAAAIQEVRERGYRRLIAAIGPANGWSADAKSHLGANGMLVSLGAITLPHELARLVLAEQLYRATTILAGHPYHLGHE